MKNFLLTVFVLMACLIFSGCNKKSEEAKSQTDNTTGEIQDKLDEQQEKIDELQKLKEEQQQASQEQQQLEEGQKNVQSENGSANVVTPKNCSADVVKYCSSESFTEEKEFKKFLKVYEDAFSASEYQKYKKQFTAQFNKCQEALRCD